MSEQWYYGQDGVQKGPVGIDQIQQLIRSGHLRGEDLVWREGMANWAPASSIQELFPVATPVPPSPAAPPAPQAPIPPTPYPPSPANPAVPLDPQAAALQSKATTAMVLGICSIVFSACVCAPIGLILGVFAVVQSKNAELAPNAGSARAGLVCGIIGIALSLMMCLPQYRYVAH